jgi:hypothetical protein
MAKNRWFGTWVLATLSLLGIRTRSDLPILQRLGGVRIKAADTNATINPPLTFPDIKRALPPSSLSFGNPRKRQPPRKQPLPILMAKHKARVGRLPQALVERP